MTTKLNIDREYQLLLDETDKAKIGSWETNRATRKLYWSGVTKRIHEVEPDYIPNVAKGIDFYKPGANQEIITDPIIKSYTTKEKFDIELKIITVKGDELSMYSMLKAAMVGDKCIRHNDAFEDITSTEEAEINYKLALNRLHDVFEESGIEMLVMEPIYFKITEANSIICSLLNHIPEHIKISPLERFVSKEGFPILFEFVTDLLNKKMKDLELDITPKILIKIFKHKNQCRVIFQDNVKKTDMKLNGHKVFGVYKTFHGNEYARGIRLYVKTKTKLKQWATVYVYNVKKKKKQPVK